VSGYKSTTVRRAAINSECTVHGSETAFDHQPMASVRRDEEEHFDSKAVNGGDASDTTADAHAHAAATNGGTCHLQQRTFATEAPPVAAAHDQTTREAPPDATAPMAMRTPSKAEKPPLMMQPPSMASGRQKHGNGGAPLRPKPSRCKKQVAPCRHQQFWEEGQGKPRRPGRRSTPSSAGKRSALLVLDVLFAVISRYISFHSSRMTTVEGKAFELWH
jgi:hypothetical protein